MANQAEFLNNIENLINEAKHSRNQGFGRNYPRFDCEIPIENQVEMVMRANPGLTISVVNNPLNEAGQPQSRNQSYGQNLERMETYSNQIYSAIERIESNSTRSG